MNKKILSTAIIALAGVVSYNSAHAALPIACNTQIQAGMLCANTSDYVCPTGETGTNYSCPSGWLYKPTTGLCERSGSSTGSDSSGSYTTTYGTCDPETTTYPCYKVSSTYSSGCSFCPKTSN